MQNQGHLLKKVQPKKEMKQMRVFPKKKLAKCLMKFNVANNSIGFRNSGFRCVNNSYSMAKNKTE